MPYIIRWAVPKHVLITTFKGLITKEELVQFMHDIRVEIQKGEHPICHISNSLAMDKVQLSLPILLNLIKSFPLANKLSWSIDINRNPTNTMLASLATQFVRVRVRTVKTLEDAVEFLKQSDLALRDATWDITPPIFPDDAALSATGTKGDAP